MSKASERRSICIVSRNPPSYSETFIKAHIEQLPTRVLFLYGPDRPRYLSSGELILQGNSAVRIFRKIATRMAGLSDQFFAEKALAALWKEKGVSAVLAEYGPVAVGVMNLCKKLRLPLIAHFHGFDAYVKAVLDQNSSYSELFHHAAAVIAVSTDMEKQLLRLGAPRDKLFMNPYGVDHGVFVPTTPGDNPPIFVAVGRFVDKKAPHLTILAFHQVLDRVSEARLLMLGDGPLHESCRQLIHVLRISESVDLPGSVPPDHVIGCMQRARCFVQHSVQTQSGDSEGTPVAILEAGASGLPVVATRHAGICDAVIHEQTGLLVDEGDVDSMAEYMFQLATRPEYAARLGAAARERIVANFSMETSIEGLWKIILSVH